LTDPVVETSDQPEPVRPAATVVMVRDGDEGLEVLLVQRNKAVSNMGGMWVFPGGKVDESDYPPGGEPYEAAANAAIRETHEEAGLTVTPEQLVYLSHWTTPVGAKRRFATWFFLTILENDQDVVVDGGEIANYRWVRPQIALAESLDVAEPLRLVPPTFVSLKDLSDCSDCAEAREIFSARQPLQYAPRMVSVTDGICFLYQGDAGYESESVEVPGNRHRLYMVNDKLDYIREL